VQSGASMALFAAATSSKDDDHSVSVSPSFEAPVSQFSYTPSITSGMDVTKIAYFLLQW